MLENGIALTDSARELAELCESLRFPDSDAVKGEAHLAARFEVEPWSLEFYQIVFTVMARIEFVREIISKLEMDEDFRSDLITHVLELGEAFGASAMRSSWSKSGQLSLGPINVQPLKGLSQQVRQNVAYRKLSAEDIVELQAEVSQLLQWLRAAQSDDHDFIRQAMIEGLEHLGFRLARLKWVGSGHMLDSLREVISAYMALERQGLDPAEQPQVEAILKKAGALIQSVYAKVKVAKDVVGVGDWLLRAYGAGAAFYHAPAVTALLTSR